MFNTDEEFERIAKAHAAGGDNKLPASAINAVKLMGQMIRESDSPADVCVALGIGIAYISKMSVDPDHNIKLILALAEQVGRLAEKSVKEKSRD